MGRTNQAPSKKVPEKAPNRQMMPQTQISIKKSSQVLDVSTPLKATR